MVIDDLLYALVGVEGRYISIKRVRGKEGRVVFQIDPSMDLALQVRGREWEGIYEVEVLKMGMGTDWIALPMSRN